MEFIQQFLIEDALILIPVLYIIGLFLKSLKEIKDEFIPIIIWLFGVLISIGLFGFNIDSFIQGTLVSGATVFASQLYKQATKKD